MDRTKTLQRTIQSPLQRQIDQRSFDSWHETKPITFDQALWEECQNQKFYMVDSNNVIGFPLELQGKHFDPAREKELRQDLYILRVLAKTKREKRRGGS